MLKERIGGIGWVILFRLLITTTGAPVVLKISLNKSTFRRKEYLHIINFTCALNVGTGWTLEFLICLTLGPVSFNFCRENIECLNWLDCH